MTADELSSGTRRKLLAAGVGAPLLFVMRPVAATPEELTAAISAYAGGGEVRSGGVKIDIARLVDNGNNVPVTVTVDSPMTPEDRVNSIALFNERNPERDVARFQFGPRAGRASVSTNIRLATSQKVVAVARMSDGTFRSGTVDVLVTLAACIEGES